MANTKINTDVIEDGAITNDKIAANSVNAEQLNVSGNGSNSQFLRSDGDGSFSWATPVGYTGPKLDIFTSSGTWTVPNGVTSCKVFVIGGGGGGQVGYSGTNGKSGGSVQAYVPNITPGSNITVTIGQGGAYQNGTGGTSSFGSYATGTGGGGRTGSSGSGSVGSGALLLTRGDNGSTSDSAAQGGLLHWIDVAPFRANIRFESNGFSRVAWSLSSSWNPGAGGSSANNSNGTYTCAGVDGVVIIEY